CGPMRREYTAGLGTSLCALIIKSEYLLQLGLLRQLQQVLGLDDEGGEARAQPVVDLPAQAAALLHHRQFLEVILERDDLAVRGRLTLVHVDQHVDDDDVQAQVPDDREQIDGVHLAQQDEIQLTGDGQDHQRRQDRQRLGKQDGEEGGEE